jgi:hypothetical protein
LRRLADGFGYSKEKIVFVKTGQCMENSISIKGVLAKPSKVLLSALSCLLMSPLLVASNLLADKSCSLNQETQLMMCLTRRRIFAQAL